MKNETPDERFAFVEDDAGKKSNLQFAAMTAHSLAYEDVDAKKTDAMNYRESLQRAGTQPDSPAWAKAREFDAILERKKALLATTASSLARATNISSAANELLLDCRRAIGGRNIAEMESVPIDVDIPAGSTVIDTLAATIAEWIGKQRRRKAIKESPLPPEMVEKALIADVDAQAARGGIQISGLYGETKRARIAWPLRKLNAEPNRLGNGDQPRVVDMEALACRYWRKEIVAEIKAAVAAAYEGSLGDETFAPDERQKALRALDTEIDTLQRQVAELTWLAIDEGHDVDFPPDLPANAILGIA